MAEPHWAPPASRGPGHDMCPSTCGQRLWPRLFPRVSSPSPWAHFSASPSHGAAHHRDAQESEGPRSRSGRGRERDTQTDSVAGECSPNLGGGAAGGGAARQPCCSAVRPGFISLPSWAPGRQRGRRRREEGGPRGERSGGTLLRLPAKLFSRLCNRRHSRARESVCVC